MNFLKVVAIIVLSMLFFTCKVETDSGGGGGGGDGDVDDDVCGGATKGCIQGSIVDESDVGITSGATVTLDSTLVATANTQGWYYASDIDEGDQVFCYTASGYVENCRTVTVVAKATTSVTPTVLTLRGDAVSVEDAEYGGTAEDTSTGGTLTFDPDELCDANGDPVSGTINCYFTPIDVTVVDMPEEVPDSFLAVRADGVTKGVAVSTALMELYCDQNGAALSVCSGKTLTVRVPVYGTSAECAAKSTQLPGWRFATDTAEWNEYDTGTFAKNCGGTPPGTEGADQYYEGEVDHISWINVGDFEESACLTGGVSGEPEGIAGYLSTAGCFGTGWRTEVQIGDDLTFCVPAPVSMAYTCRVGDAVRWIDSADYLTGTSPSQQVSFPVDSCPATGCYSIGNFVFDTPVLTTTLTWGEDPRDLDSHTRSQNIHVFYNYRGSLVTAPYIELDTDDRFSYGPEITTVMPAVFDGTYCFYVHKFAGDGLISQESTDVDGNPVRATVTVQGVGLGKSYVITSSNPNSYEYWRLYTIEFEDGEIVEDSFTEFDDLVEEDPSDCEW